MKKTNEKLQLNKETIAQLNDVQLNNVRGGSGGSCWGTCVGNTCVGKKCLAVAPPVAVGRQVADIPIIPTVNI